MEDLVSATLCTAENVSFELFQTQGHPQPVQNSTCQLQPSGLKVSLYNRATISDPQPILI